MSQFLPKQNQGDDDTQPWQQHVMYKQPQELRRKQQLQQFHGARQQNSLNPLFAAAKSAVFDRVPSMLNEMPINEASSYPWSDNNVGELSLPNDLQMFGPGNMNWAHFGASPSGHNSSNGVLSNNHTQSLGTLGLIAQPPSQPVSDIVLSGTRGSVNQNSHFLGMTPVQSDPFNTYQNEHRFREQACLNNGVSNSMQNFQVKSLLRDASVQSHIASVTSVNPQQVNHLQNNIQIQEFHGKQIQADWSGNLQEKFAGQGGFARGETSLDPTEQKLLFGTDENVNWGALFERSTNPSTVVYGHGNPLETDNFGSFPSLQSGSWSALMQDALQASSSDNRVQEQWTGLSFQQTEQSIANPSSNDKRTAAWDDISLQSASSLTLRPFAVHADTDGSMNNTDGSMNHTSVPSSQYPFKSTHEQERLPLEFSYTPVPVQQSTEEVSNKNFYQNLKAKQSDECRFQEQMHYSDGNWVQRTQSHGNSHYAGMRLRPQSPQGALISSEKKPAHKFINESSGAPNSWISNNHLLPSGERSLANVATHSRGYGNLGRGHNQPSRGRQVLESSRADTLWTLDNSTQEHQNMVSNEGHILNSLDHGQPVSSEFTAREDSLFPAKDTCPPNAGCQKSLGQPGQQTLGSHLLQNHAVGNLGMNVGPSFTLNPMMYSGILQHSALRDSNNLEQRFVGHSQVDGNIASNKSLDAVERMSMGEEEMKHKCETPGCGSTGSSFDGLTAVHLQNRTGQTSQNMLELLHKVDTSRNTNTVSAVDMPEQTAFDVSASRQQLTQPPLKGFGLQLDPSSQRQPVSSHSMPFLTLVHNHENKQQDSEAGDKDQTHLPSTSSIQSLPPIHSSQVEHANNRSSMSEQAYKETTFLRHQMNSNASESTYILQQQNYGLTQHGVNKQSLSSSFGSQNMVNAAYPKQTHDSHGALSNQSVQAELPGFAGRVLPYKHNSSPDDLVPASSQLSSAEVDRNGVLGANFPQARSSGQQLPVMDTRSGSQPAMPGISNQVGAPTQSKNVWTNISVQQRPSGLRPNKIPPSILQSMMLSTNSGSTCLWGLQKMDDQGKKGENASEVGTSSANSHSRDERQVSANSAEATSSGVNASANRGNSLQGQDSLQKNLLDGSSNVPISPLMRFDQHDVKKPKHVGNLTTDIQAVNASMKNDGGGFNDGLHDLHGHAVNPPDVLQHSHSLLHQVQAMKHADYDQGNRFGKRLKEVDASHADFQAGQRFSYEQNNSPRVPIDSKIGSVSQSEFALDVKMLSFASRDNEERSVLVSSQDICIAQKHDIQNSATNLMERNECHKISSQMAPSWFEQYGADRNGQTVASYDSQRASQLYNPTKLSWSMDVVEQRTDSGQFGYLGQSIASSKVAANCWPSDAVAPLIVMRSKKRKSSTSELLSWHKVIEGTQKLWSFRMAEMDWAWASNRLIEKVEGETEMLEDIPSFSQPRRRLILATQLAQQLLPAVQAAFLRKQAALTYESITYCVAKVALGDACSLISCAGIESRLDLDNEKIISESKSSEKVGNDIFAKVVEVFIGRFKKLENDFTRLNKRTSFIDVPLECQEAERFSIVNRLGRFHGRNPTDGVEGSSTFGVVPRAQRHVISLPMPGNLPEGVPCLSL